MESTTYRRDDGELFEVIHVTYDNLRDFAEWCDDNNRVLYVNRWDQLEIHGKGEDSGIWTPWWNGDTYFMYKPEWESMSAWSAHEFKLLHWEKV